MAQTAAAWCVNWFRTQLDVTAISAARSMHNTAEALASKASPLTREDVTWSRWAPVLPGSQVYRATQWVL
jgi:hypothetical protein